MVELMDIASFDGQIKFQRIMALHKLKLPHAAPRYRPSNRRAFQAPRGAMQRVSVKTYFFTPDRREGYVSYMGQEGKGEDGRSPELFTAEGKDREDALKTEYAQEERIYKIILSPENGGQLDMKEFTRGFMKNLENSEGREFKWAAAVHYDTEHPHAHILIRGVDESGRDVSFSKDTVKYGMRGEASRLATMELGCRTPLEMQEQKEKDLRAERFTQYDKKIKEQCGEKNTASPQDRDLKTRLEYLSSIGLAEKNRDGSFTMDKRFDSKLKQLQRENDILKTVYGKDAKVNDRDFSMYRRGWTVDGVIIRKGIENEVTEKPYALIQNAAGKKYYVSDSQLKDYKTGEKIHIAGREEEGKMKTVISPSRQREEMGR
jgi:hypothetical protein